MNNLTNDLVPEILKYVSLETRVLYIPYNDGEQSYTIFYKDNTIYRLVCKKWSEYFTKEIFLSA
jgi:hypothetical protein